MLSLASWGWADQGIGVSCWGCQKQLGAEWGSQPQHCLSSAQPALSLQPGKLTEAFKYFLQGMGYSECRGWAWGWCGSVCADLAPLRVCPHGELPVRVWHCVCSCGRCLSECPQGRGVYRLCVHTDVCTRAPCVHMCVSGSL